MFPIEVHTLEKDSFTRYSFDAEHGFLEAFHMPKDDTFELFLVEVDPDHTREGIGTALVAAAVEKARELHAKRITGRVVTSDGLALLQKLAEGAEVELSVSSNASGQPMTSIEHRLTA